MRRTRSSSGRTVALVAAFCVSAVAAGCGRESFDLVPEQPLDSAGAGLSAGGAVGQGGGGSPTAAGRASGGNPGKAGGGAGGRFTPPSSGGSNTFPCLGEGGCPDELCPPYSTSPFCNGCRNDGDCESNGDAKRCNLDTKRCVQCRI